MRQQAEVGYCNVPPPTCAVDKRRFELFTPKMARAGGAYEVMKKEWANVRLDLSVNESTEKGPIVDVLHMLTAAPVHNPEGLARTARRVRNRG